MGIGIIISMSRCMERRHSKRPVMESQTNNIRAHVIAIAILLGGAPACGLDDTQSRDAPPGLNEVYIDAILGVSGTGCKSGVDQEIISPDKKSFVAIFNDLEIVNPSDGPHPINCRILVRLHIPGNWKPSVARVNANGYVSLDAGLEASHESWFDCPGSALPENGSHRTFEGPIDQSFSTQYEVELPTVGSPSGDTIICDIWSVLNIDFNANPTGVGMLSQDELGVRFL